MRPGGPRRQATKRDWAAAATATIALIAAFGITLQAAGLSWLTLVFWGVFFVGYLVVLALPDLRQRVRKAKGLCPACGYDRRGLSYSSSCPECGLSA